MERISAIDWRQLNSYLDFNRREGNQRTTGSVVDHVMKFFIAILSTA